MSLSYAVREYVLRAYIYPARLAGEKRINILVGDVHKALNYKNRYPLVCSALGSQLFEEQFSVRRIAVEGPLNGASTLLEFELK